jgi:hypothetical protein
MVNYEKFEDWFDELENFSFRSERFFQHLELTKTPHERREFCELWLRTAFEMGRYQKMKKEFKEIQRNPVNNNSWIVTLEKDGEDLILPLTDEMLAGTGWKTGDTLLWERAAGQAWTLRKKP